MEDLQHILIVSQEIEQRLEIDALGQRIDRGGFFRIADLHEAQFRPIGVLAHELGIDADEISFGKSLAQIGERLRIGNQIVYFHQLLFLYFERKCRPRPA